jgi:hypothetical protein
LTIDQATAGGVATLGIIGEVIADTCKSLVAQAVGDVGGCISAVVESGRIYFLGAEIGEGHVVGHVGFDFKHVGSLTLNRGGDLGHHARADSASVIFGNRTLSFSYSS